MRNEDNAVTIEVTRTEQALLQDLRNGQSVAISAEEFKVLESLRFYGISLSEPMIKSLASLGRPVKVAQYVTEYMDQTLPNGADTAKLSGSSTPGIAYIFKLIQFLHYYEEATAIAEDFQKGDSIQTGMAEDIE